MAKSRTKSGKPATGFLALLLITLGIGAALGYAWGVSSVEITDTGPWQMESSYQGIYVQSVADSYALDGNAGVAAERLSFICQENNGLGRALAAAELRYGSDPAKKASLDQLHALVDSGQVQQSTTVSVCNRQPLNTFARFARLVAPLWIALTGLEIAIGYWIWTRRQDRKHGRAPVVPMGPEIAQPEQAAARPAHRQTRRRLDRLEVKRMLRRFNLPLATGIPLVALFVFVTLFGPGLAPHDPMESFYIWQDEDGEFHRPPLKPMEVREFPLGTDYDGRDIWRRLLEGIRPSIVLAATVALTRLAVGGGFGFLSGWYEARRLGRFLENITQLAASLPLLIVAIMLLYLFKLQRGLWPFVVALSLTGWANSAQLIGERVRLVRSETFIEAARALGARDGQIFWRHVLPQVRTLLPIIFSFEMGGTLLQMAELGFVGFYLGGGAARLVPDPLSPGFIVERIPGTPELGQILSAGWDNFFLVPWMAVWGGLAFFAAIFAFMVLGEGLRQYYAEYRPGSFGRLLGMLTGVGVGADTPTMVLDVQVSAD